MSALVSGCGGCGDDTAVEPDAADVDATLDTDAPTTTATPIAGVYRAAPMVTLTADEPATIYYTIDGSTPTTSSASGSSPVTFAGGAEVQFFAVDAAGNEESPQSIAYTIDRFGPTAVSGFTATVDGADIDLAWTNPTDASFDEVVIARVADVSTADPADDVIYTGAAEAFTDPAPGAGHHTYVAWARHDTGEVGEARTAGARIDEAAQSFTISINVTGGTATVSAQPTSWALAIADYADNAGNLTFDLTATSGLAGVTFVPKVVIASVVGTGGASTWDSEDGTADFGGNVREYQNLGAEGLVMGGAQTIPVEVDANGATAITITGEMVTDQGVFFSDWTGSTSWEGGIIDLRTDDAQVGLPPPTRFSQITDGNVQWLTLVLSPDGRYLYAAPRTGKLVLKIDTTTFAAVSGIFVSTTRTTAAAGRIALDPSGKRLYVGVTDGGHSGGSVASNGDQTLPYNSALSTADAIVLEVDTATMTEVSRTTVRSGDGYARLARVAISPDGRTLATMTGAASRTPVNMELHLYDLPTWTELDPVALGTVLGPNITFDPSGRYLVIGQASYATDANSFGVVDVQTMTLATYTAPNRLAKVMRSGNELLAAEAYDIGEHLQTLDAATGVLTDLTGTVTTGLGEANAIVRARDGRIFQATTSGLYVYDANGNQTGSFPGTTYRAQTLPLTP